MAKRTTVLADFKAFINKGNVVDLAVAVIIAGAFGKVVNATVKLIMTNALEPALEKANVQSLAQLPGGGGIIVATINLIVIAFACFTVVRVVEKMKRKEAVVESTKPDPQAQLASAITRLTEVMEERSS